MRIRRVFRSGNSLVVSLPPEFTKPGDYVVIKERDGHLILERFEEVG